MVVCRDHRVLAMVQHLDRSKFGSGPLRREDLPNREVPEKVFIQIFLNSQRLSSLSCKHTQTHIRNNLEVIDLSSRHHEGPQVFFCGFFTASSTP